MWLWLAKNVKHNLTHSRYILYDIFSLYESWIENVPKYLVPEGRKLPPEENCRAPEGSKLPCLITLFLSIFEGQEKNLVYKTTYKEATLQFSSRFGKNNGLRH